MNWPHWRRSDPCVGCGRAPGGFGLSGERWVAQGKAGNKHTYSPHKCCQADPEVAEHVHQPTRKGYADRHESIRPSLLCSVHSMRRACRFGCVKEGVGVGKGENNGGSKCEHRTGAVAMRVCCSLQAVARTDRQAHKYTQDKCWSMWAAEGRKKMMY